MPSKEKKKEKKSKLLKKLGRSKSEQVTNQSQQSTGLTGLLETMRVQMEVQTIFLFYIYTVLYSSLFCLYDIWFVCMLDMIDGD